MSDKGLPQNAAATLQPDFLFDHMDELTRRAPEMRRLEERLRSLEAPVTDTDAACVAAIPGDGRVSERSFLAQAASSPGLLPRRPPGIARSPAQASYGGWYRLV